MVQGSDGGGWWFEGDGVRVVCEGVGSVRG